MAKRKQGWKEGKRRGKKSKVPNPDKKTFGDKISEINKYRKGEKKKSVFSNRIYGSVICFIFQNEKNTIYAKEIYPLIKPTTWTNKCRKELKKLDMIDYEKKKGGRNSKFTVNHEEILFRLTQEFRNYMEKQILVTVHDGVVSSIRKRMKSTLQDNSVLSYRKKYKREQGLGIFSFFLETLATDNYSSSISTKIDNLNEKYETLLADTDKDNSDKLTKIETELSELAKQRDNYLLQNAKLKEENAKLSLDEIRSIVDKKLGEHLENSVTQKDISDEMNFVRNILNQQIPFIKHKLKQFSIHDIFKELVLQLAVDYRIRKSDESLAFPKMIRYYRISGLYETFVVSDFESN